MVPHHHLVCSHNQDLREALYADAATIILQGQKKHRTVDFAAVIKALWFNVDEARQQQRDITPAKRGLLLVTSHLVMQQKLKRLNLHISPMTQEKLTVRILELWNDTTQRNLAADDELIQEDFPTLQLATKASKRSAKRKAAEELEEKAKDVHGPTGTLLDHFTPKPPSKQQKRDTQHKAKLQVDKTAKSKQHTAAPQDTSVQQPPDIQQPTPPLSDDAKSQPTQLIQGSSPVASEPSTTGHPLIPPLPPVEEQLELPRPQQQPRHQHRNNLAPNGQTTYTPTHDVPPPARSPAIPKPTTLHPGKKPMQDTTPRERTETTPANTPNSRKRPQHEQAENPRTPNTTPRVTSAPAIPTWNRPKATDFFAATPQLSLRSQVDAFLIELREQHRQHQTEKQTDEPYDTPDLAEQPRTSTPQHYQPRHRQLHQDPTDDQDTTPEPPTEFPTYKRKDRNESEQKEQTRRTKPRPHHNTHQPTIAPTDEGTDPIMCDTDEEDRTRAPQTLFNLETHEHHSLPWSSVTGFDLITTQQQLVWTSWNSTPEQLQLTHAIYGDILGFYIRTLWGNEWLQDPVINQTITLMQDWQLNKPVEDRILVTNTFFKTHFLQHGVASATRRWNKQHIDIMKYKYIIVPLNLINQHWALMLVDHRSTRFVYQDSLGLSASAELFGMMEEVVQHQHQYNHPQEPPIDFATWTRTNATVPMQPNVTDCGVHVLRNILAMMEGADPTHLKHTLSAAEAQVLRRFLAYQILVGTAPTTTN